MPEYGFPCQFCGDTGQCECRIWIEEESAKFSFSQPAYTPAERIAWQITLLQIRILIWFSDLDRTIRYHTTLLQAYVRWLINNQQR